MKTRVAMRLAQAGLVALSLGHGAVASATPDFPAVVVKTLDLPGITIDPPQGCELCHATDAGGTSLRPFGTILLQYGTQPYQENTLEAALGQVAQNEPQLLADIKAGKDPNDDSSSTVMPTPEYGCATAPARSAPEGWLPVFGALVALAVRRWRVRTRPRLPRRRGPR